MIASLRGTVLSIGLGSVVIECQGVGYEVTTTPNTLSRLQRGEEAVLLTTLLCTGLWFLVEHLLNWPLPDGLLGELFSGGR